MGADLISMFKQVCEAVRLETDTVKCWTQVLRIAQQDSTLESLEMRADAEAIAIQMRRIIEGEPLPTNLSFVYFGLFELAEDSSQKAIQGFYFSGGTAKSPAAALDNGDLSYFPENRFLRSDTLDSIKQFARSKNESRDLLEYVVIFGAAAILAKYSSGALRLTVPIYAGFDSGDYSLIVE